MPMVELVLLLLFAVAVLAYLATRVHLPYPIVLVLGGLALGFVPGLPTIELEPQLIFLLFLPVLLYADAWSTSWRDFRFNLRPISLLAIGLVIATTLVVAVVAHAILPNFSWAAAFVLGAIVSPTDAVASTAIAQRLGAPRRLVTIVEGESLVNDASGLVLYRFALVALITGVFSFAQAGLTFLWVVTGGVGIGLAIAWLYTQIERRLDDSPIEITLSFLVPFAAYIPAEAVGASGVLAAVAAGLYVGRKSARIISPASRVQAEAVWGVLIFLLNGLAFILIGLQLRALVEVLRAQQVTVGELIVYGVVLSLVVIVVRLLWVFPGAYLPYYLFPSIRVREPMPRVRVVWVLGWMGMRGVVSLAAALALPLALASGQAFHERPLIVLLTYCVILATLVGQGLTLPALMRKLHVGTDGDVEREEEVARLTSARAALRRIDELAEEKWTTDEEVSYLRAIHEHRTHRYDGDGDVEEAERDRVQDDVARRLKREVLQAERQAVIQLRDEGTIGDEVLRRLERELDLQDIWLEG
ncbi:MAG TPA: Na+/H+ antiporter [Ktedonobacterales bacterium]